MPETWRPRSLFRRESATYTLEATEPVCDATARRARDDSHRSEGRWFCLRFSEDRLAQCCREVPQPESANARVLSKRTDQGRAWRCPRIGVAAVSGSMRTATSIASSPSRERLGQAAFPHKASLASL